MTAAAPAPVLARAGAPPARAVEAACRRLLEEAGIAATAAFEPVVAGAPAPAGLGAAERRTLAGLSLPKRRDEWLAGRRAGRRAAAALLGDESGLEVVAKESGAPAVLRNGRATPAAVSIAHAGGLAGALAWRAGEGPLGLDLEPLVPVGRSLHAVALTAEERAWALAGRDAAGETARTLALWTSKEAVLKALEVGLRADLRAARAEPREGGPWRVVHAGRDAFRVHHATRAGYVLAVARPWGEGR